MGDTTSNTDTLIVKNNQDEQQPTNPNPILSLLTNFNKLFNFPPQPKSNPEVQVEPVKPPAEADKTQSKPPVVATFPTKQTAVAPLKLEPEDLEKDTNTNPALLWQVYAIGGFFVLKWAWARWNERKAKKKTSKDSEDPPTADE